MWVKTSNHLMNLTGYGAIIRETNTRLSFRYKNREGYRDITYDTKEECEKEFNRLSDLLLNQKPATVKSSEAI